MKKVEAILLLGTSYLLLCAITVVCMMNNSNHVGDLLTIGWVAILFGGIVTAMGYYYIQSTEERKRSE